MATGIVVGTGLVFGLSPPLTATRIDLDGLLQAAGSRLTAGATSMRLLSSFVVLEIAFALCSPLETPTPRLLTYSLRSCLSYLAQCFTGEPELR